MKKSLLLGLILALAAPAPAHAWGWQSMLDSASKAIQNVRNHMWNLLPKQEVIKTVYVDVETIKEVPIEVPVHIPAPNNTLKYFALGALAGATVVGVGSALHTWYQKNQRLRLKKDINALTNQIFTTEYYSLLHTAKENNYEACEKFIDDGANLQTSELLTGMTALHYAAKNKNAHICELLLFKHNNKSTMNTLLDAKDKWGRTPRTLWPQMGTEIAKLITTK